MNKIDQIKEIIQSQKNNIVYRSSECTRLQKSLVCDAFTNLLQQFPSEMSQYLLYGKRGRFQHKIFQEYIRLLELSLPFSFTKNKKFYRIESLLDATLNIFDGISSFDTIISKDGIIKNATKELYVGGRKATVIRPYYIGKLLGILDKKNKQSLMHCVNEYTFSLIKTKNIISGTKLTVTHLRISPHYQMGAMTYVNRMRKNIVNDLAK